MVGSVVEWLERRDQHNLSSKPIHTIILCPGEIHGTFHCLAVLVRSSKIQSYLYETKKKKYSFYWTAVSWDLWKHVRFMACPIYSASDALLYVRKINIEMKKRVIFLNIIFLSILIKKTWQ